MACSIALVVCLLLQPIAAQNSCDRLDDVNSLMQTSATPRKAAMRELLARAASHKQSKLTEDSPKSVGKKTASPKQSKLTESSPKDEGKNEKSGNSLIIRPNAGKGPEHIAFAMQCKTFYGFDFKTNKFTMDLVLTTKWTDKRAAPLIPKGAVNVTLSQSEASKHLWLPQIDVTNRDVKKTDVISTSVIIHKGGDIVKVQRLVVVVKDHYDLKQYPFDTQDLNIKIGSTQYMSSELLLKPEETNMTSVPKDLFDGTGFEMSDWKVSAFEDDNGELKVSRGQLTIQAQRLFVGYLNSHVISALCLVALGCGVFWFPFTGPFVTPRMVMSVVTFLSFIVLAGKSNKALPATHDVTWNDILNQNIEMLMVLALCFNIYSEVRHHVTRAESVALKMNNELQVILPVVNVFVITMLFIFGAANWSQTVLDVFVKIVVIIGVIAYVIICENRLRDWIQKKLEADGDDGQDTARYSDVAPYGASGSQMPTDRSIRSGDPK